VRQILALDLPHLPPTGIASIELKHYRTIMLSSTLSDLKKHREQAIRAIRELSPANVLLYEARSPMWD
jgi:hypothetical protein